MIFGTYILDSCFIIVNEVFFPLELLPVVWYFTRFGFSLLHRRNNLLVFEWKYRMIYGKWYEVIKLIFVDVGMPWKLYSPKTYLHVKITL